MSALAMSVQKVSGPQATRGTLNRFRRRWMHGSLTRQAIMMPAMSPLMNEGTVARWKKKEGESFAAGEVLLQIESDIAIIDVEANNAGILGKILVPDGTSGVPVEQILALVARDERELAHMQGECRTPTPIATPVASSNASSASYPFQLPLSQYNFIPEPPSTTMSALGTGGIAPSFGFPLLSPRTPTAPGRTAKTPRTPSLFELQSMGAVSGYRTIHSLGSNPKGATSAGLNARKLALDLAPQPPSTARSQGGFSRPSTARCLNQGVQLMQAQQNQPPLTPKTAVWPLTPIASRISTNGAAEAQDTSQMDGAAIRRMIVLNLASSTRANSSVSIDSDPLDDVV